MTSMALYYNLHAVVMVNVVKVFLNKWGSHHSPFSFKKNRSTRRYFAKRPYVIICYDCIVIFIKNSNLIRIKCK